MPEKHSRGIDRENQNSRVFAAMGYTVVNDPKLKDEDGLNMEKNPDHRINGVIFDSYAPTLVDNTDLKNIIALERLQIIESGESFDIWDELSDYFTKAGELSVFELCAKYAIDGLMAKVKEGQTNNILLSIQDLICRQFKGGYRKTTEIICSLLKSFGDTKTLETVFVIHPGSGIDYSKVERVKGGGESWIVVPDKNIVVTQVFGNKFAAK